MSHGATPSGAAFYQQYFVEGLSEEIINALTQIRDMKDAARTSVTAQGSSGRCAASRKVPTLTKTRWPLASPVTPES